MKIWCVVLIQITFPILTTQDLHIIFGNPFVSGFFMNIHSKVTPFKETMAEAVQGVFHVFKCLF